MKIHLVENIIESVDRRKEQQASDPGPSVTDSFFHAIHGRRIMVTVGRRITPHDYSKKYSIISVPAMANPPENINDYFITKEGCAYWQLKTKPDYIVEIPYSKNDLIIKSQKWIGNQDLGWQPASSMPPELAHLCKQQWEVVKVLKIEMKEVCKTSCDGDPSNGDPIDEEWSREWYYRILVRKKVN